MQTTSIRFRQLAAGHVRPISYGIRASFDKVFDDEITFFTLDSSLLNSSDVLAPSDDNPIQVWDKYEYADLTDRVVSIEVTREETAPYSIAQAYADIALNNYDNYFTHNSGSPIENFILPRRPFRALMGLDGEVVPQIVGMTEGMPQLDTGSRTATFHIVDFMSYLLDQDLGETTLLQDVTTTEILDYLFQHMGLLESQYVLDPSFNTVRFFYIDKGTKFRHVADKLMEAEIGRLYMDEAGIIRFKNRYSYSDEPVMTLDKSNVIEYSLNENTQIINSVRIESDVRAVQKYQSIWKSVTPVVIKAGSSTEVWPEFADPVTSVSGPIQATAETNDSYYMTSASPDGTLPYSDVTVDIDVFSRAAKLTFTNTGSSTAYVNTIDLYGTPAKVIDRIRVTEFDEDSIAIFEEQPHEIDNEYIQDAANAQSRALMLLNEYSSYGTSLGLTVKGSPALQLGDCVLLDLDGYQGLYAIIKTTNIIDDGFIQRLCVRKRIIRSFFTLNSSLLDSEDVLTP